MTAAAALVPLLWSLPRGLDLSDEGYYLTEIAHPGDTSATVLLFGWLWHPVYAATGGSVTGLRLAAFLLAGLVSAALAVAGLRLLPPRDRPGAVVTACVGAVAVGLTYLPMSFLPATPSYNALAQLALTAAALGCALAWSGRLPLTGGALVGVAGFAAVAAKPTTAVVLALAVSLTTPWRRTGPRPVVAALAACGLCVGLLLLLVPGHLDGLAEVVRRGVETTVGHADLIRRDPYGTPWRVLAPAAVAATAGACAGLLARRNAVLSAVAAGGSGVAAAASLWWWAEGGLTPQVDLLLPSAALTLFGALVVAAAVSARRRTATREYAVAVRLAALLVALPLASAIGTNTNLWQAAGRSVVFWFLAVVLLVGAAGPVATAAGALAAYTALVSAVVTPLDPYRGGPLAVTEPTTVARDGTRLRLPTEEARATTRMLAVGDGLGVTRETRVLDLTGASPGVVWAWGARPLASAWVIGGYPESFEAARVAVEPVRCELPRTLLLWAPGGGRAIPDDVLEPWGVRVPADYRAVASFPRVTVPSTPANPEATVETVTVLEPVTVRPDGCPGA